MDPLLASPADNGGAPMVPGGEPPRTVALHPDSAAIDAGNPAGCTDTNGDPLPADQSGAFRLGRCDLGSYELGGIFPTPIFADGFESGDAALWSF